MLFRIVFVLFFIGTVHAEEPWERSEPFTAPPEEIVEAAEAIEYPDDRTEDTLYVHTTIEYHEDHRRQKSVYSVWRVKTEADAQQATIYTEWSPWFHQRPVISARVIRPDGTTFMLDPKTIAEVRPAQSDSRVLSDDLAVQAALPGVTAGSIIEQVLTLEDARPFCPVGVRDTVSLIADHHVRVTVSYPKELPVNHLVAGIEAAPKTSESDDNRVVEYEVRKPWRSEDYVYNLPRGETTVPYVTFSTGKSWREIARYYAELVEAQIDTDSVRKLTKKLLTGNESAAEAVDKFLVWMRTGPAVRYTGIEFGKSAIVPHTPTETLARGFGDCKDKTVLLISMLRAAGFDAHATLVNSSQTHLKPELPGLNAFNHVIAYVEGDDSFFVDPTTPFTPSGELPTAVKDRHVLVAKQDPKGLQQSPPTQSTDNQKLFKAVIHLSPDGLHRVKEESAMKGFFALEQRRGISQLGQDEYDKLLNERMAEWHGEQVEVEQLDYTPLSEQSSWFHHKTAYDNGILGTHGADAILLARDIRVCRYLPYLFRYAENEDESWLEHREQSIQLPQLYVFEETNEFHPPMGYEISEFPSEFDWRFGPLSFSRSVSTHDDVVTITYCLDTGDGLLTEKNIEDARAKISDLLKCDETGDEDGVFEVRFESSAYKKIEEGDYVGAIAAYKEILSSGPQEPLVYAGLVDSAIPLGLGVLAHDVTAQLVEDHPDSADAWATRGYALAYDKLGRTARGDLQASIAAYEKAVELEPSHAQANNQLGLLHQYGDNGSRFTGDLENSAEYLRKCVDDVDLGTDSKESLYFVQMVNEDFESVWSKRSEMTEVPGLLVAITAKVKGFSAAKRKARQLSEGDDNQYNILMAYAASALESSREYELAKRAIDEVDGRAMSSALKRQLAILGRLSKVSPDALHNRAPDAVVRKLIHGVLLSDTRNPQLRSLMASYDADSDDLFMLRTAFPIPAETPPRRRGDAVTVFKLEVEGTDEFGFTVTPSVGDLDIFFVLPPNDQGEHKILLSGRNRSGLGHHALQLIKSGQTKAAVFWLDRAKEGLDFGGLFNPHDGSPFARIWASVDKSNPNEVRLAAACLAAEKTIDEGVASILEESYRNETSSLRKTQVARSLIRAYKTLNKHGRVVEVAKAELQKFKYATELQTSLMGRPHQARKDGGSGGDRTTLLRETA